MCVYRMTHVCVCVSVHECVCMSVCVRVRMNERHKDVNRWDLQEENLDDYYFPFQVFRISKCYCKRVLIFYSEKKLPRQR